MAWSLTLSNIIHVIWISSTGSSDSRQTGVGCWLRHLNFPSEVYCKEKQPVPLKQPIILAALSFARWMPPCTSGWLQWSATCVTSYLCSQRLAYKATLAAQELLVPGVLRWKWHQLTLKSDIWACQGITAQRGRRSLYKDPFLGL